MTNLAFDDVMIEPNYSDIEHRTEIDITSRFLGMDLKVPIISANMSSITEWEMAVAMLHAGAFYVLHRFYDDRLYMIRDARKIMADSGLNPISISVGIRNSADEVGMVQELM